MLLLFRDKEKIKCYTTSRKEWREALPLEVQFPYWTASAGTGPNRI